MLKKMPRPYKAERLGDTRATRLNREGISPLPCVWVSGHGGRVQRTSLVREKTREPSSLAVIDNTDTIHDENSEANCVESLHIRHVKRLAAEGT